MGVELVGGVDFSRWGLIFLGGGWHPPRNYDFLDSVQFRNELQLCKLASGCTKILQKTYRRQNFDFSFFLTFYGSIFIFFAQFFLKKSIKSKKFKN